MAERFESARSVRNLKVLAIVGCLGTLLLLGLEAYREHFAGEWHQHQDRYRELLPAELRSSFEPGILQAFLPELERVDRCQTCHAGIDNPTMAGVAQPLQSHPGDLLRAHPPETFGCTICHQGQGRATRLPDAHGEVPHWEEPLLRGSLVYTTCGRCHPETSLFGDDHDMHGGRTVEREISSTDLERGLPGANILQRGKQLAATRGCLGCHTYRGRGGTLGPDLTLVGDKGVHGYDFSRLPAGTKRTPLAWLMAHFLDPGAVSPGTLMPGLASTLEEAEALAAYMLSLKSRDIPARYRPPPLTEKGAPASGQQLYALFCLACHGPGLDSSRVPAIRTPSLGNEDFLGVADDAFLTAIIKHGQSGTAMPAWSEERGGLSQDQIDRLVQYIRSHEPARAERRAVSARLGDPGHGRALYRGHCASCHGLSGEGGLGTALAAPEFLAMASDDFIVRTIVEGRPGTAMPSWRGLNSEDVSDLLAFLRSWQGPGTEAEEVAAYLREGKGDLRLGARVYAARCAECHGLEGQGTIGPSLTNPAFLSIVPDAYLIRSMLEGRPGTAMPSWRDLEASDIGDLVLHLRSFFSGAPTPPAEPVIRGDPENGSLLFARACASCHGPEAVGGVGPQLRNPAFLAAASDGFLWQTVARGRPGTAMRGFLRGDRRPGVGLPGAAGVAEYSEAQIADLIAYLRSLPHQQDVPPPPPPVLGSAVRGKEIYESTAACARCHGLQGQGAAGPAVGNPFFLDHASEGFLLGTLVLGRRGTEMRTFGTTGLSRLSSMDLMDVTAYVRTLGPVLAASPRGWRSYQFTEAEAALGEHFFELYCSSCHGPEGRGGYAPELNNPEFLAAASDGFLVATIARGRRGTPMRAFGPGSSGLAVLTPGEITSIVAYLRHLEASSKQSDSTLENNDG